MRIGVFDSGIGGQTVADAISRAIPAAIVTFVNDRQHVPYGDKTADELFNLVVPILQQLAKSCQVIVIACNTVSVTLAPKLRQIIPVPIVALDPMVKPAAQLTKTGTIAVCATPTTLASERYEWLKKSYAANVTVLEPNCSDWSKMIEANNMNHQQLAMTINQLLTARADVIVLGCTHYHWIESDIKRLVAGRAQVLQPEAAIVRQLKRVMATL